MSWSVTCIDHVPLCLGWSDSSVVNVKLASVHSKGFLGGRSDGAWAWADTQLFTSSSSRLQSGQPSAIARIICRAVVLVYASASLISAFMWRVCTSPLL